MSAVVDKSLVLRYSVTNPPYSAVIISSISKYLLGIKDNPVEFILDDEVKCSKFMLNDKLYTEVDLIKNLCSSLPCCKELLSLDERELNYWLNILETSKAPDGDLECYSTMDSHLCTRTLFVGHRLTIVDLLSYSFIKRSSDFLKHKTNYPHLNRWLNYISNLTGAVEGLRVLNNIVSRHVRKPFTKEEQRDNSYKDVLKNAKDGEVVTRFPPEPSGYLHIGHAKAALLNHYFAQRYNGKLIMRFDDTNPSKECDEYVESIKEDVASLGIKYERLTYTSDYFDLLQEYAIKLIKSGDAYCDDTDVETMRKERGEGIESASRSNSIETNLKYFDEMVRGTEVGTRFCMRGKVDMTSKNKSLRDPVFYRCVVGVSHVRHGNKYSAYPTYDFACPIIDSIEGVTHALRTCEYSDRIPLYKWVIEKCNLRPVEIYEYSRLNFVKTTLSKRRLRWFVDNNIVTGWDDPRMPTVKGILRRGLTVEALLEFILAQGPSKSVNLMEWDKLWSINKQIIDPIVPRYSALNKDYITLTLDNVTESTSGKRPLHPKNPDLGECDIHFTKSILIDKNDFELIEDEEEVTLMKWGNAFIHKHLLTATLNPQGNFKLTKKKINWLPNDSQLVRTKDYIFASVFLQIVPLLPAYLRVVIPCTLKVYGHLLRVDKIDEEMLSDDSAMRSTLEPESEWTFECVSEVHMNKLEKGKILQLERRGYYIVDSSAESGRLVLVGIPDGKMKKK